MYIEKQKRNTIQFPTDKNKINTRVIKNNKIGYDLITNYIMGIIPTF